MKKKKMLPIGIEKICRKGHSLVIVQTHYISKVTPMVFFI